ncbi:hypothetical protein CXG81DRAFT_15910 [Caulochytrium protostelioides]|uniref:NADH-ubiquinone oxidoreductase 9.5 kDa subunit n=1 Tax=Caulochytrium protostelioides TaxID=1555241 RepID=A0A4P9WXP1_9FUNG|nr:hypothetical protein CAUPRSCDRAFT_8560 [Caulochytrium protostelioides]RKO98453.1 hypothetical protein CXG81DRAFT_15910 [Caulochytrium protostelioides]|eukprot:RKO98453.1 hypothetical protein CXG81DRAFT_15910 [Caulochytrium protostelioides]
MVFSRTFNYLKYNLYHYPVIVTSFAISLAAPVLVLGVYPVRREMGYTRPLPTPTRVPIPDRAREALAGFDDDAA